MSHVQCLLQSTILGVHLKSNPPLLRLGSSRIFRNGRKRIFLTNRILATIVEGGLTLYAIQS